MKQKPIPNHMIPPATAGLQGPLQMNNILLATSSASASASASASSSATATDEAKYTYSMDDRFTLPTSSNASTLTTKSKSKLDADVNMNINLNDGLCLDQKGFFSHLSPRSLMLSTVRTSILQASTILTSYFTEQLHHESSLEEKMIAGEITPLQLDFLNSQWEEEEWEKRWKTFPDKLKKGLVKYHVLILVMRAYEGLFGLFLSRQAMDRLTKDPFKYAINNNKENTNTTSTSTSTSTRQDTEKSFASDMFQTCFYANIVSFLADYTIQQTILCYGFYTFIKNGKRERRLQMLKDLDLKQECGEDEMKEEENILHSSLEDDLVKAPEPDADSGLTKNVEDNVDDHDDDLDNAIDGSDNGNGSMNSNNGGLLLSFTYKSSKLLVARSIGLFVAGLGGAVGSIMRPGWGTVFGIQLGDACIGAILDE